MNGALAISGFDIVLFVVLAIVLFALLRGLRFLLGQLELGRTQREALDRALPVVETFAGLVYLLTAAPMILDENPEYAPLALVVVVGAILWVSWAAIRDVASGLVWRSGQLCREGDYVELEGLEGRVRHIGYRALTLQTPDWDEAILPYSQLSQKAIKRKAVVDGAVRHTFRVIDAGPRPLPEAIARVKRAALVHHWSSALRPPRVDLREDGLLDVTVFALSPEHGPEIETAVREAVARPGAEPGALSA